MEVKMSPKLLEGMGDKARVGIALVDAAMIRYPWYIAIYKGFVAAGIMVVNILLAFYYLLKNLILGNGLIFQVAGPVGIAVIVGNSVRLGISYLLNTAAMLSLSLAVINILPIPALDGGRIAFNIIELLRGKPVPLQYEVMVHTVGFGLLLLLLLFVSIKDVKHLLR